MGDVIKLSDYSYGHVTPKELLEGVLEDVEEIETLCIVYLTPDGEIRTGWCKGTTVLCLGLADILKDSLVQHTRTDD